MYTEGITSSDPNLLKQKLHSLPQEQQTQEIGKQFEAIFYKQMLKDAFKPTFESDFVQDNSTNEIYNSLLVDHLSQSMANANNLKFSQLFQQQVKQTNKD